MDHLGPPSRNNLNGKKFGKLIIIIRNNNKGTFAKVVQGGPNDPVVYGSNTRVKCEGGPEGGPRWSNGPRSLRMSYASM